MEAGDERPALRCCCATQIYADSSSGRDSGLLDLPSLGRAVVRQQPHRLFPAPDFDLAANLTDLSQQLHDKSSVRLPRRATL